MTVFVSPDLAGDLSAAHFAQGAGGAPGEDALVPWLQLASLALDAPIASVLSTAHGEAAVLAHHGLSLPTATPMVAPNLAEQGFWVVPDTRANPATRDHPWVTHGPRVAFLAAVVLRSPDGGVLGTLCLMDTRPRTLSDREAQLLATVAGLLAGEWSLRHQAHQTALQHQALEQSHGWLLESVSLDPLTQVANRRALMAFLEKTLALARREAQPLAVLLMDIRGFKHVNSQHGDAVGDGVLAQVAGRLAAGARGSELVGRMSGDEFMAILYPCTPAQATLAAERFAAAVQREPVAVAPATDVMVSVVVGIFASAPAGDLSPDELYRRAALALDTAKEAPHGPSAG